MMQSLFTILQRGIVGPPQRPSLDSFMPKIWLWRAILIVVLLSDGLTTIGYCRMACFSISPPKAENDLVAFHFIIAILPLMKCQALNMPSEHFVLQLSR